MTVDVEGAPTQQILEIFRRKVKRSLRGAVRLNAHIYGDLGLDSLAVVSILLEIEQELGLKVPWNATGAGEVRTIGDVILFITGREKR